MAANESDASVDATKAILARSSEQVKKGDALQVKGDALQDKVDATLASIRDFDARWERFQSDFKSTLDQLAEKVGGALQQQNHAATLSSDEVWDKADVVASKCAGLISAIQAAKGKVVIFTGAGISTAAGIPDYRSPEKTRVRTGAGVWTRRDRQKNIKKEEKDDRAAPFVDLGSAKPTAAHRGLAALVKQGWIKHVVSQNIDGLHRLSGIPRDALSELHGNVYHAYCRKCGAQKEHRVCAKGLRIKNLGGVPDAAGCATCGKQDTGFTKCHCTQWYCTKCPDRQTLVNTIVHFGENLNKATLERAQREFSAAEVCVVLGSSCRVSPASHLPMLAKKTFVVNGQLTQVDSASVASGGFRIGATCDEVIDAVCSKLCD